jgi:cyclophilin family peptidyl-prolyl cis-trans isomerase
MKEKIILVMLLLCSQIVSAKNKKVIIETTAGNILIEVYEDVPLHSANFLKLVKAHKYDSLLFHRVIKNFMIQGGDPDSKYAKAGDTLGNGDLGYTIPAEFMPIKYFHKRGALAAARDDIPSKASSAIQFYIVQGKIFTPVDFEKAEKRRGAPLTDSQKKVYTTIGGTPHLDGNYTVYGQVLTGMEIVDAIANAKTDSHDRPITDFRITSMKMVKRKRDWGLF